MAADPKLESAGLSLLLQLEAMARNAESDKALQFLIVNESRRLINYRQAFLFSARGKSKKSFHVEAASSLSIIDHSSPFIDWLNHIVLDLQQSRNIDSIQQIDANSCPEKFKQDWEEYSLPFVLWCPLVMPNGNMIGGIWLAKETPWTENEVTLVKRLSDSYAHAWGALMGVKHFNRESKIKKIIPWAVILFLLAIGLIPIRMSALAPVEIVAKDPVIVSASIDGVISDVSRLPNTFVEKGDTVFIYEDTNLRNQYEISKKTLSVTVAELKKARQAAFGDKKSKAEIALLKSQVELRQAELDYAEELLKQVKVKAEKKGLLIYTDKDDWIGRSVRVGERIMEIADPEQIKFKIELAVTDAIVLKEGADVDVFLDIAPLHSLSATLIETTYNAEINPSDVLVYKLHAELLENNEKLRIGLQGTAKIYGNKVSLFFYLFRRPISAIRQFFGL